MITKKTLGILIQTIIGMRVIQRHVTADMSSYGARVSLRVRRHVAQFPLAQFCQLSSNHDYRQKKLHIFFNYCDKSSPATMISINSLWYGCINAILYYIIPCNTTPYHELPCNAMQCPATVFQCKYIFVNHKYILFVKSGERWKAKVECRCQRLLIHRKKSFSHRLTILIINNHCKNC